MDERRPNILLLFPDQHRPDWLGCLGRVPVRTPHLDALAARGLHCRRTYCTSPLCAPSRASLAGGMRPHQLGVNDNGQDFPTDRVTFYQLLRDSGYRVGAVGKTDLHKATHQNGPDGWTERMGKLGFTETVDSAGKWDAVNHCRPTPHDPYTRYLAEQGLLEVHLDDFARRRAGRPKPSAWPTPLPQSAWTDEFVGRAGLDMLSHFPREAPWFLQVNFPSPHEPFDAPAEYLSRYDGVEFPGPFDPDDRQTAAEHQACRRNYAAMVEAVDEWCGRFIRLVAERGELDQTLVVYASDHGEMLGDHGRWGKSVYYEPSMGVPLLAAGPGVSGAGRVSEALVELPDLGPTFLELAGLEPPQEWEARSLRRVFAGETDEHRDFALSVLPGHRAICDGRYKLIYRDGQIPALFDLDSDPHETTNVTDQVPEVLTPLLQQLGEEMA